MALPGNKRRKTSHISSSSIDADDDRSFASREEVELEDAESTDVTDGALDVDMENDNDESLEDDDASDEASQKTTPASKSELGPASHKPRNSKSNGFGADAQAGAAAYASGTFKSNVFKMQVDELLSQIRPKHGNREAGAESALHTLRKTIEQLPAVEPCSVAEAEQQLIRDKVSIPFPTPRPPKDAKYKLAYSKPSNVNVVGSFVLKTTSRSQERMEVDMVVTMPKSLFEEKDFLNYRYFYKRAHYLARLASGLKRAHGSEFALQYRHFHDDPLKPVLTIRPLERLSAASESISVSTWQINVIPSIAQDQFTPSKLQPDKNCVRNAQHVDTKPDETIQTPTPFYNSSLRCDMLMTVYLKLLHGTTKRCSAFVDASLLGCTWLRQRGFGSSIATGGFGNFEWKTLIALCIEGGGPNSRPLFSEGYSSYQLLKAALHLLAGRDFRKQPLIIGEATHVPVSSQADAPILWDGARAHNVLFKMSPWSYSMLRAEARNTLNALSDPFFDGFDATFILNVKEPLYRFDSLLQLPLIAIEKLQGQALTAPHESLTRLYSIFKRGLGDRVNLIGLYLPQSISWGLGSSPPRSNQKAEITIGFAVNPENINRTVEHGPSAENKAAAIAFREFWGGKAELRRFKDGSILESVVWAGAGTAQSILEQIIHYLLQHHFSVVDEQMLPRCEQGYEQLLQGSVNTAAFNDLRNYFNKLENDIRDLRELPLSIRQIMPADAQLRFSSIKAPLRGVSNTRPDPADVTLQFEGSGRWPDDLVAIQRTKIAFMLKIEEMLQETSKPPSTRIGLENEGDDVMNQAFLEVTYNSEASFRLRIYHDREQTLLERELKDPASDPKSKELAAAGLAKYKRDFIKAPAHTQAIARLCSRHPALSGSIRLTKKWFASHLLSNHVAEEVIELLVALSFTQPWPWQVPSSPQVGFLRTLFWISRWDWRADPLIVDLSGSGSLREAELKAIHTRFEAWRKLDPALNRIVLFAASNVDHDGTTWTDGCTTRVAAGRMTALAKAACAEIPMQQSQLKPASLFSSQLDDFDFVIYINSDVTGTKLRSKQPFKNLQLDNSKTEDIGLRPVKDFLDDLQTLYGSAILFFHGASERSVIAGLWNPITAARSWKVNLAYSTFPSKGVEADQTDAIINKPAVLAEIAHLGGDLIKTVHMNR